MPNSKYIKALRNKVEFEVFEVDLKMNPEYRDVLSKLPKVTEECRVKHSLLSVKSAFGGMWEYAVICGYTNTMDGLKALVLFTERELVDGDYDWALVPVAQIKSYKPERRKEVRLRSQIAPIS